MRKKVLSVVAVLLGGAWASAQSVPPGYASVGSGPRQAGPVVTLPAGAVPPEPVAIGGVPTPGGWGPVSQSPPMGAGPGAPGGMGVPMGPPPGVPYGPPYPGGFGPDFTLDPPSSFGTESVWVTGRYLMGWFSRPQLSTPLVTTGSTTDPHPGGLGQPNTRILFGSDQYQFNQLSGAQVDIGVNLNDRFYLELSGMVFAPRHVRGTFASDVTGSPFIGRPVFNTLFDDERSYLTSSPGLISGVTQVEGRLQIFGLEANARYQVNLTPYLSVDGLIGYRRLQMEEDITIRDNLVPLAGSITFLGTPVGAPNVLSDLDRFAATNQFNGVNFGTRFRWQSGFQWFAMNGYGKLALGATRQTMEIEGFSAATSATGPKTAAGGVLALPSNIGFHERTVFGVIPEGGVGIVILPYKGIRLHAGYSATYWNSVVRPGDHIDRRVNPALVPTDLNFGNGNPGAFPAFSFHSRSAWIQAVNFGVELYY
jgi:hypothetical protein